VYYLAYGSNLHPYRLSQRVPSAQLVDVVSLPGLRLGFQKRSKDGSAKCLYVATACTDDRLHAAVYRIADVEKPILDAIEGLGQGYDEAWHRVRVGDSMLDAFAYTAAASHIEPGLKPYDWYREMVVLGAKFHALPKPYIESIRGVDTSIDPDSNRAKRQQTLCESMRRYRPEGISLRGRVDER
jgi:gamma-glutamylcyclotransferase